MTNRTQESFEQDPDLHWCSCLLEGHRRLPTLDSRRGSCQMWDSRFYARTSWKCQYMALRLDRPRPRLAETIYYCGFLSLFDPRIKQSKQKRSAIAPLDQKLSSRPAYLLQNNLVICLMIGEKAVASEYGVVSCEDDVEVKPWGKKKMVSGRALA